MIENIIILIGGITIGVAFGYVKWVLLGGNSIIRKAADQKLKESIESLPSDDMIPRSIWGDSTTSTSPWSTHYTDENGDSVTEIPLYDTELIWGTIPKPKPSPNSWIHENKRQPKWAKRG